MTPLQKIQQRLKEYSQKDLADQLGVSPAYLSDVINGRREAGAKLLAALGLEKVVSYRKRK